MVFLNSCSITVLQAVPLSILLLTFFLNILIFHKIIINTTINIYTINHQFKTLLIKILLFYNNYWSLFTSQTRNKKH